jgi:hypothetical protein
MGAIHDRLLSNADFGTSSISTGLSMRPALSLDAAIHRGVEAAG